MDLVCPRCRRLLQEQSVTLACPSCGSSYRTLRGIPDLRTVDDEFLSNRDDWDLALRLDAAYDRLDFPGLLNHYYDLVGDVPADLRARQIAHILSAPARAEQWMDSLGARAARGPILDLGCGPGSFLATNCPDDRSWVGLDIAMRWLILARKRLDEEGKSDVRVVCGCAEMLPFADRSFSAIIGGDVIEHVRDQAATLAEAHRVLEPLGRAFFATPNRFSLAPEPHVGVWGVGYLPRKWMQPYVHFLRKIDFRAIHTLGWSEWKRLLRRSPFETSAIFAPSLPVAEVHRFSGLKQLAARLYNRVVQTRPGQVAARTIGPLFHIVAERSTDPLPAPIRAIRQPSTLSASRP
ncbi:MAG: Methyltransferase protein [Planctomycetota bacterium]|nr:Methyltransferase protein [Planctomycetota bacterium]